MNLTELSQSEDIERAINWLYERAEQIPEFNSDEKLLEFDPEWILEKVENRRKILRAKPEKIISGELVKTRYQKNWYQTIYSSFDSASLSGYITESTRRLTNAFSEYVNSSGMKYRDKTCVDVALGSEVLDWIADDLKQAISRRENQQK